MSASQEVTAVQLSEKDKQVLQEKYKAQRQAMWSGKQSTSQDSEKKTAEADQGEMVEDTTSSTDIISSDSQSDSSATVADQPASTEIVDAETNQNEARGQTKSDAAASLIVEDTEEQTERQGGRVFWEVDQEGGSNTLTWKLALAVIGIAIVLIGVGVYLGFLFAS